MIQQITLLCFTRVIFQYILYIRKKNIIKIEGTINANTPQLKIEIENYNGH